ncbi:MAG: cytochrome c biogenesis protein CcsA [Candidatus Hydrogenedentes bacterium]|nr:cytochrome c biogenesis protein CcsA [Candidatus Hydrogenedentota bacterium]
MPLAAAIPFYLAMACYVVAAGLSLAYVRGSDERVLFFAKHLAAAANVGILLVFLYRWWSFRLVPLTGMVDSLNLFLVLSTGIILMIQRNEKMKPLLAFYLPALAIIAIVNAAVAPRYLGEPPTALKGLPLTIHVGLVFLAFALFFVASMTSLGYVIKARGLKSRVTTGFAATRLPSLERLDNTLYRLIGVGYPAFLVTAALGLLWAWAERDLLGTYWFVAPKILLSLGMVALYAVSFHMRRFGLLRGPKLAYLVFFGFTFLLVTYLVLGVLKIEGYTFLEATT